MKDMHSDLSVASAIDAATLTADSTPTAIDLRGYDGAEIVLAIGAGGITFSGSNKIEFKLTHSNDDVTYEPVTKGDVLGVDQIGTGGVIKALVAAHATADVYRFGVRVLRDPYTNKPYVHFYTTKRVGGGVQNFEAIKLLKIAAS